LPLTEEVLPLSAKGIRMKAGEMSDEQIVAILQEAQKGEKTIVALCKEKGITQNPFYLGLTQKGKNPDN